MSEHSHGSRKMPREDVKRFTNKGADKNIVDEAIDLALDLPFVLEGPKDWIYLDQTEALVDYLVEECDRNPRWFKEYLDQVPNYVWDKYGVPPPTP